MKSAEKSMEHSALMPLAELKPEAELPMPDRSAGNAGVFDAAPVTRKDARSSMPTRPTAVPTRPTAVLTRPMAPPTVPSSTVARSAAAPGRAPSASPPKPPPIAVPRTWFGSAQPGVSAPSPSAANDEALDDLGLDSAFVEEVSSNSTGDAFRKLAATAKIDSAGSPLGTRGDLVSPPTTPDEEKIKTAAHPAPSPSRPDRRALIGVAAAACALALFGVMLLFKKSAPKQAANPSATSPPTVAALLNPPAERPSHSSPLSPEPGESARVATATPSLPSAPEPAPTPSATRLGPAVKTPGAPIERRKILGGKKMVLEYDPRPTEAVATAGPTLSGEDPTVLSRARDLYHRGNMRLFSGDAAGALSLYRDVLRVYPGYVAGYRGLGLAYAEQGKTSESLQALRTYLKTVPQAHDAPLIRKRIERMESEQ
jgi:hypothetical protein